MGRWLREGSDGTGALRTLRGHALPAMLALVCLGDVAVAMPHLELIWGGPSSLPTADRSALGSFKRTSMQWSGATAASEDTDVQVKISRKHAQIATISLGTPWQPLKCLIDSGSSDLWVPSKRCYHCENNNHFAADKSTSFKPELVRTPSGVGPRVVKISYGSGQVSGFSVKDDLRFGALTIPEQAFIIVEDAALPGERMWDGICGLGWKGLAQVGPTLYERIQQQGMKAVFSIVPPVASQPYFPSARGMSQAHMTVGEIPSSAMDEDSLAWVDAEPFDPRGGPFASEHTFWVISGGLKINRPKPVRARFLVDTGTNQVLLVPRRFYPAFISSLIPPPKFQTLCGRDRRLGVICDCSIMEDRELRPLQLHLGGKFFALPVSQMFMKVPANTGRDLCLLTIQPNSLVGGSSSSVGIGDIIGGLLGALFGPEPPAVQPRSISNRAIPEDELRHRRRGEAPPPLPFSMPPGSQPREGGVEVVEDITETMSNGTVCKIKRLIKNGEGQAEKRRCYEVSVKRQRRLSGFGDSPEELWMIGGVFLESLITIFDFDNKRLGFAKPAMAAVRSLAFRNTSLSPSPSPLLHTASAQEGPLFT